MHYIRTLYRSKQTAGRSFCVQASVHIFGALYLRRPHTPDRCMAEGVNNTRGRPRMRSAFFPHLSGNSLRVPLTTPFLHYPIVVRIDGSSVAVDHGMCSTGGYLSVADKGDSERLVSVLRCCAVHDLHPHPCRCWAAWDRRSPCPKHLYCRMVQR